MGNCLRSQSSVAVWAGDDWGSVTQVYEDQHTSSGGEKQKLLGDQGMKFFGSGNSTTFSSSPSSSSSSSGSIREVKIKITKRELEELMAKVEMQGLTMEQGLARLINNNYEENYEMDHHQHHQPRSWKPALQSIPEGN